MKIRNIMFSGFAAAIFAGVCGAADAASVNLVSKTTYEAGMAKKQNVLTPGDNINIDNDIISATGLVTESKLTEVQTALQTAIDGKQAAGDYAAAGELSTLAGQVGTLAQEVENLKDTSASDAVIKALNDEVDAIAASVKAIQDAPYASEDYVSTAIEAVKDLIPTVPTVVSAFENDAGYITNAALTDYAKSADVSTALASKADTTALESAVAVLEAAIEKKQDGGDYLVEADLSELNAAVESLKTEKATVASVTALQNAIDALGDTYATDAELTAAINEVKGLIPTVPTVVSAFENDAGYITNAALADYAKSADVSSTYATQTALGEVRATADAAASKTYVDAELAKKQNELQLGENLQWVEGKLDTKGIATADGLAELENKVNNAAQKTEVATDIAAALEDAKQYADNNDADTIYDDTEIKADIAENAAAIQANATAIASKANSADVYTKGEVDAAIAAIEEYDDTALTARVSANETGIANNKSAIEALQTKTTDLGALAYKNTVASADIDEKAVTTAKIAGEAAAEGEIMMMTAGADGVATWTSVKVY